MANSRRLSDYLPTERRFRRSRTPEFPACSTIASASPSICAVAALRKLQSVDTSNVFRAILASLLEEDWTTPNIVGAAILARPSPDGSVGRGRGL